MKNRNEDNGVFMIMQHFDQVFFEKLQKMDV